MADPGFPGQHTTTTRVTSSTTVQTNIRFDKTYIRTVPGILKIVELVLNFVGFICIEVSNHAWHSRGGYFIFVAMTGFWVTGVLLAFYLFHIIEKTFKIPWLKVELVYGAVMAVLYIIAASLAASFGVEAYKAAAFFGFCGMVAYAFDAYLKYVAIRNGELAQGERVIAKETSTVTSPTY